ncbi:GNAT family N-acetyltransferase [Actinomadura flavalba]|uniref:GNAT family N-acetyltransferase n=1 Tax=Actinomadura flavalba TaxID=1120938 RepID=UPI000382998A|nr:GNAT family N-acetyltransferase [Actinomadura flavalba]
MDVTELVDPTDAQIRQWHDVLTADPSAAEVPSVEHTFALLLGANARQRLWAAPDAGGFAGVAALRLPGEPGADRPGEIDVQVRPAHRRRGLARRLLTAAARGLREDGRSSVIAQVSAGTAAVPFLESHGFTCVLTVRELRLRLADLPPGHVASLLAAPPAGYTLARWRGVVPDEHAGALARAKDAMADLVEYEGSPWDAHRVREMGELVAKRGDDLYTVAALRDGVIAGFTEMVVPSADPAHAAQYDTAVVPSHRGRRLGLWMKAAMLDWLTAERPEIEEIETDNSGDDPHMLAVNHTLGFHTEHETREYQATVTDLP